jgi:hypothetical protein
VVPKVKRLLIPSAALLWGLQFAFLNPALALLLVALFDATAAEVGWVLAVYNGSGFGSLTPLGYGGVFAVCAGLTALALVAISVAARIAKRDADTPRPRRRRMMVVSDTSEPSLLVSEHTHQRS